MPDDNQQGDKPAPRPLPNLPDQRPDQPYIQRKGEEPGIKKSSE